MKNKFTKLQQAQIYRMISATLADACLKAWREALDLEGFNKKVKVRKDGKIVIDASKFKSRKKASKVRK